MRQEGQTMHDRSLQQLKNYCLRKWSKSLGDPPLGLCRLKYQLRDRVLWILAGAVIYSVVDPPRTLFRHQSLDGYYFITPLFLQYNLMSEITHKLIESVRSTHCKRKNCASGQKDPADVVWFGRQYSHRDVTCSACFVCNNEAIKNAIPTQLNVLPLSLFVDQFVSEMRQYQKLKSSAQFFPKVVKQKGKELLSDLKGTENQINEVLKQLAFSMTAFAKKVEQSNAGIFRHEVFEEIIAMNTDNKFDCLLDKIVQLIAMLNFGQDQAYHFQDTQLRFIKLNKLKTSISQLTQRTLSILKELSQTIKLKTDLISKI